MRHDSRVCAWCSGGGGGSPSVALGVMYGSPRTPMMSPALSSARPRLFLLPGDWSSQWSAAVQFVRLLRCSGPRGDWEGKEGKGRKGRPAAGDRPDGPETETDDPRRRSESEHREVEQHSSRRVSLGITRAHVQPPSFAPPPRAVHWRRACGRTCMTAKWPSSSSRPRTVTCQWWTEYDSSRVDKEVRCATCAHPAPCDAQPGVYPTEAAAGLTS